MAEATLSAMLGLKNSIFVLFKPSLGVHSPWIRVRSLTDELCRNVKCCQVNEKVAALPISFEKASYTKEKPSGIHKHF